MIQGFKWTLRASKTCLLNDIKFYVNSSKAGQKSGGFPSVGLGPGQDSVGYFLFLPIFLFIFKKEKKKKETPRINVSPNKTTYNAKIFESQPILVEGRAAICLYPLVCKGFNADFWGNSC